MTLEQNIEEVLAETRQFGTESIEEKLRGLQNDLFKLANAKKDYTEVADEIDRGSRNRMHWWRKLTERD